MRTVWKFPIELGDQLVSLPARAEILHVGLDPQEALCLWARVDTEAPKVERTLYVTGTGTELPDGDNRYIGTIVLGPFVWHFWEPR